MYLESDIIGWARTRGIFTSGTPSGQAKKMLEEAGEVLEQVALYEGKKGDPFQGRHIGYLTKEIGDVLVTAVLLAEMFGLTTDDCLSAAWDSIKNRRGKMVNGQFVKESV